MSDNYIASFPRLKGSLSCIMGTVSNMSRRRLLLRLDLHGTLAGGQSGLADQSHLAVADLSPALVVGQVGHQDQGVGFTRVGGWGWGTGPHGARFPPVLTGGFYRSSWSSWSSWWKRTARIGFTFLILVDVTVPCEGQWVVGSLVTSQVGGEGFLYGHQPLAHGYCSSGGILRL